MNLGILLLIGTALGTITAWMAGNRRRNALAYGALGFCFFLPTVIALGVLGPCREEVEGQRYGA
ncbi:MAG: hypothetical protein ABI467_20825 [Kofleriaceae bacterium]